MGCGLPQAGRAVEGVAHLFTIRSSGTHGHTGWSADPRAVSSALARGYDVSQHKAACLSAVDYSSADFLLALDSSHVDFATRAAPAAHRHKVLLLSAFARCLPPTHSGAHWGGRDIADPYYEDAEAFENVLDGVEAAADGLVCAVAALLRRDGDLCGAPLAAALRDVKSLVALTGGAAGGRA